MKHFYLLLISCFISFPLFAQYTLQSHIFDEKTGEALELINIRLFNAKDTTLVQGTHTDVRGGFVLNNVAKGKYILLVSSIGYIDHSVDLTIEKNTTLKNIQLKEDVKTLSEVVVKGTAAQMLVRGDTLEYNATAFKTAENAVVEDLLKRLPGVEITQEGKITVNGEEVKKIRVDGKKFFDGDIEMATKNLPAEMIEKIQVLEEKSDMAKLTGFEDEDSERIINLTTKPNRKRGLFTNVTGGIGMDTDGYFRYDANGVVNIMEGNSQTAVTGGANNINTSRSNFGRIGGSNGIVTTQNLGANNNTILNDKLKLGGSGSFNHSSNEAIADSYKLSYLRDSIYTDSTFTIGHNENYSANVRLEAEWKPDTMNTFIIQPNVSYRRSFSDNMRDFIYYVGDDEIDKDTTSLGNNVSYGNSSSIEVGLNVIYNHKFAKKGRTLTASIKGNVSQSDSESYNFSYRNTSTTQSSDTIDQYTTNNALRYNLNTKVSFVEPLWNVKNLLEISAQFRTTTNTSQKDQYDNVNKILYNDLDEYSNAVKEYTDFNEEYSNNFRNNFFSETVELNYRYTEQNYNLTLGIKAEPSQTYSYTTYGDGTTRNVENEVANYSPNGRFQYNFGKKEFIRIDYRGSTGQPSVNQMQPVKNNSNLMNQTIGNPNLNPAFSHRFRLFYSTFNDQRFSSFNTALSFNMTKDALVSNSIYDKTGKQYNQTVNANAMPYSINGNVMYNTPIIQKRLHFNTRTNVGLNQRYGYSSRGQTIDDIDIEQLPLGDLSSTRQYTANEQLSLTFTHDVIEVGSRGSVNYRKTVNNLKDDTPSTWDWNVSGNVVLHLPYNINISTDINYTTLQGYANFDRNELIWNASIDKSLFKNRGVIAIRCADILRQRMNVNQVIGDNYTQYSRYNTLTSYFLVSFSYKLNKFPGASGSSSRSEDAPSAGRRPEGAPEGAGGRPPRDGGGGPRIMIRD